MVTFENGLHSILRLKSGLSRDNTHFVVYFAVDLNTLWL